jgi:hypothetical protein
MKAKTREMRDEAVKALEAARIEVMRSRAALGHAVRDLGTALRAGWLAVAFAVDEQIEGEWPHGEEPTGIRTIRRRIARSLVWMHPEAHVAKAANVVQGCRCNHRDAAACWEGEPFGNGEHSWCYCEPCHGAREPGR